MHNQFIPKEHLKSQEYLEKLHSWSLNKKMELNLDKTKAMILNFSRTKQFTISLSIQEKQIEVVNQIKLLGTIITSDLKRDQNIANIIKRANARMVLLRKLSEFKLKHEDMKIIYIAYIRSVLEQSCQVWHHSLSEENCTDLERIQKNALKIILGNKYKSYEDALDKLNLDNLQIRREKLCEKFAKKILEKEKTKRMFLLKENFRKLKNSEQFAVNFGKTTRYFKSAIPQMQRLLNKQFKE